MSATFSKCAGWYLRRTHRFALCATRSVGRVRPLDQSGLTQTGWARHRSTAAPLSRQDAPASWGAHPPLRSSSPVSKPASRRPLQALVQAFAVMNPLFRDRGNRAGGWRWVALGNRSIKHLRLSAKCTYSADRSQDGFSVFRVCSAVRVRRLGGGGAWCGMVCGGVGGVAIDRRGSSPSRITLALQQCFKYQPAEPRHTPSEMTKGWGWG